MSLPIRFGKPLHNGATIVKTLDSLSPPRRYVLAHWDGGAVRGEWITWLLHGDLTCSFGRYFKADELDKAVASLYERAARPDDAS